MRCKLIEKMQPIPRELRRGRIFILAAQKLSSVINRVFSLPIINPVSLVSQRVKKKIEKKEGKRGEERTELTD